MKPFLISLPLVVFLTLTLTAAEPVVSEGLVLWVNASAQGEARDRESLPPISHLEPVDFVLDSSAGGRRLDQIAADNRPVFITNGETAFFRFDGKDDFLPVEGPGGSAKEVTLFLLAAPQRNPGEFSALFASSARGRNDYTHGLNLDFGPARTEALSVLNIESAGASGARDLLEPGFINTEVPSFGDFHVFTVRSKIAKKGVEVFLDGFKGGERDRSDSRIGLDQMTIGARLVASASSPPHAQGFFDGGVAEVLVYDRALDDDERQRVEKDLLLKIATLPGNDGHALETVTEPPLVQMLVPGFTVEELPLSLPNLNNVRYRHDGKVVALGYDGRIHLLSDTNGDGLEDTAELFWDEQTLRSPIGIALTEEGDPRGDGVFVASSGKVSLILDKDRDGRADKEIIVADGWPGSHQEVDTVGVALNPEDGSLYFGLGTANFINPYLVDRATGRGDFDLESIRGTIQRVSPDFSERETVATGVRFTCALAFNREGELFATDQEGATWLPNGNAFDELLHIEKGRHYGFPPRHPKHLPDVLDVPAVMEFGPQHQSAVGMVFNEGVNGGSHFGPAHWEGDAIICGQSRGKLWRTKLAKTPLGYVAQNHLIASLGMLTLDACVTPDGDLLVVCHSGSPDWGSGARGKGRILKIRYSDPELPQPVLGWAAAADEFRIAFDRELDPADWVGAKEKVKIEAGEYVNPGDRFEVVRPGYQVVRDQLAAPRRWVDLLDLALSGDRRTIVLRLPAQTEAVPYAVTLPVPKSWVQEEGIVQYPEMDVKVNLGGLAAQVSRPDGKKLQVVLPHPSLEASAIFTDGSAEHEAFLELARETGAAVTLRGSVDVSNPFVPAVQAGSKLDWDVSADSFASATFAVHSDYAGEVEADLDGSASARRGLAPVAVTDPSWAANGLFLAKDDLRHPLSLSKLYLPWAAQPGEKSGLVEEERTDVTGNWLRGRRVYESASCFACHTIRGEGREFGPDLSNLVHRDRESVLKDILEPSATMNPDQAGRRITFAGGSVLSGIVRSLDDDAVVLRLPGGAEIEIDRAEVASIEPSGSSLMPDGLVNSLSGEELEDLLTYLLTDPFKPAPVERADPPAPPARRMDEITEVLGSFPPSLEVELTPLRILLCAGPKDHGPGEHDYPLWLDRWSRLLALADGVTVDTAIGFPTEGQLAVADVAVFYNANPDWDGEKAALLDGYHKRGGGAVYLHYALNGGREPDEAAERMGLACAPGSAFRHGEFDLVFAETVHAITDGFPTLSFTDETYWKMGGDVSRVNILGTALEEGRPRPQLWTLTREQSRIVGVIPGHYTWTFDDPLYRLLVFRSLCWTARQPVDRLAELITIGARLGE